jgi:hypothetical protein
VHETPTANPHEVPTNQSGRSAELAQTQLAKSADDLAVPVAPIDPRGATSRVPTPPRGNPAVTDKLNPSSIAATDKLATPPPKKSAGVDGSETGVLEALIEEGKLDEAIAGYRTLSKKHPSDKSVRAGIELVEGLRALGQRDRMEAAQRFEAALELDPSNERAARELADMRRQATNERKGLLSRLMGKKEPPP